MKYNTCWKILCALLLASAPYLYTAQAKEVKAVSWEKAVEQENARVNRQGSASVLGARIGASVERITVQAKEAKKLESFYAGLKEKTNLPKDFAGKCQTHFELIKTAAKGNKLFANYKLTALVPVDFCHIQPEELLHVVRFFNGTVLPTEARQYKKAILLTLRHNNATLWFVVNPQHKMLMFNYNDPMDIKTLDLLEGNSTLLSVN